VARLVVESGGERREYPIAGSLVIGRLRSNQVFIDDHKLSREHARIQFDGRLFILQDLGSKNGTFLNGIRLEKPEALRPDDIVKVGDVSFRFSLDASDPAAPAPLNLTPARSTRTAEDAERANVAAKIADGQDKNRRILSAGPQGPDAATAMFYYLVLGGVLFGGIIVAKFIFSWALHVVVPK